MIRIWSLPDQIHNPDCLFLRAQKTLATVLEESGQPDLPVEKTWRLNERQVYFLLYHWPICFTWSFGQLLIYFALFSYKPIYFWTLIGRSIFSCLFNPVYYGLYFLLRHYGGLTGLNKAETAAKHGEEQVSYPLLMSSPHNCFKWGF